MIFKVKFTAGLKLSSLTANRVQGTVLGPTLFIYYINDITEVINHCQIKIFADEKNRLSTEVMLGLPDLTLQGCHIYFFDLIP